MSRRMETEVSLRVLGAWATIVVFALAAALALLEFAIARQGGTPPEGMPLFPAVFGFLAFLAIVLCAAALRRLLMRGEGYYGDG